MIYKTTSAKSIVAKIFRDLKPDNGSFVADAYEWIGEALEMLGCAPSMVKDHKDVEIKNFRGSIPCSLEFIGIVEYEGRWLPYGSDVRAYALSEDPNARVNPNALTTVSAVFVSNTEGGNQTSFKQVANTRHNDEFYVLNPGMIQTSFEKGTIRVHFGRLPVDDSGFPMVPDHAIVSEAITWYILTKMIMGGYQHPIFSYQFAAAEWERTLGRAQNFIMMPSPDKMENFKKMWVSMIPNINAHENFDI